MRMSRILPWVVLVVAAAVALYFGGPLLLPLDQVRAQIVDDGERRRALFGRFVYSQRFAQSDPWAERTTPAFDREFKPMADLSMLEPA